VWAASTNLPLGRIPVKSSQVKPGQVRSSQVRSLTIHSDAFKSRQVRSSQVRSSQVAHHPLGSVPGDMVARDGRDAAGDVHGVVGRAEPSLEGGDRGVGTVAPASQHREQLSSVR
jgi:hypothetical protein